LSPLHCLHTGWEWMLHEIPADNVASHRVRYADGRCLSVESTDTTWFASGDESIASELQTAAYTELWRRQSHNRDLSDTVLYVICHVRFCHDIWQVKFSLIINFAANIWEKGCSWLEYESRKQWYHNACQGLDQSWLYAFVYISWQLNRLVTLVFSIMSYHTMCADCRMLTVLVTGSMVSTNVRLCGVTWPLTTAISDLTMQKTMTQT